MDSPCPILGDERLPLEFLWRVIENLSEPCKHPAEVHCAETDPDMQLRLVIDCYDAMPIFALGTSELRAMRELADAEDSACCDPVEEVRREKRVAERYGLAVAVDLLNGHKKDVRHLVKEKATIMQEMWLRAVKKELLSLAGFAGGEPQDS